MSKKPSRNFISNKFQHPPAKGLQETMLATGPICRYVKLIIFLNKTLDSSKFLIYKFLKKASDLELLFRIFSGPRFNEVAHRFEKKIDFKKMKFYFVKDLQGNLIATPLSQDSRNALQKVTKILILF